ncbi:MAG: hypothetical protein DI598_11840 [Pseudopedobacter saltans]|uniref:Uncharacterized protein n=1 Tax=Pseudopedobacter saltans TaxID=151895 RepID=A0A2W5GXL1_9SPHI|nr:MAG: hypothetical protein DI598_11840 [Pseudopedobacter saltans]
MKITKILLVSLSLLGLLTTSKVKAFKNDDSAKTKTYKISLDIESLTPIVLPKPTFDSLIGSSKKKTEKISFQLEEAVKRDTLTVTEWLDAHDLPYVEFDIPREGVKVDNFPKEIPLTYKDYRLTKGLAYKGCNIFFYGKNFAQSRFLLITDEENKKVLHFFDFQNYVNAPEVKSGDEDFVYEQLVWAMVDYRGVLYVSNAHSTYASSTFGKNGYITAIDLKSNKVLWRSQPLVSNCGFTIIGDHIVCGYGFTKEKDYLYYLNINTGAVKGKIPLSSAPGYIEYNFNTLYVDTYKDYYYFKVGY